MSSVNPGDVCSVALVGDIEGADEIVQSYQFRLGEAQPAHTTQESFEDWVVIFEAIWVIIKALYTYRTVFRSIRARNLTQGTLLGEHGLASVLAGGNISEQAAYQATMPVSFGTKVSRVILKKMLGPLADDAFDAGGLMSDASLIVGSHYIAHMLVPLVGTHGNWVYGYQSPIALSWVEPVSGKASKRPGALGRRRAGRGS